MEGPLDIYLYSLKPTIVCSNAPDQSISLFSILDMADLSKLQPITIHTVKGVELPPQIWAATKNQLGDLLTIVDDLSTY